MVFDFDLLFVVPRLYICLPYQEFSLRLDLLTFIVVTFIVVTFIVANHAFTLYMNSLKTA